MGNLLVAPVTEKETHRGSTPDEDVEFAVSSMQGWRVHMEDAHICQPVIYAEERISESSTSENGTSASSCNGRVDADAVAEASGTSAAASNSSCTKRGDADPSKGTDADGESDNEVGGQHKKAKMNESGEVGTTTNHDQGNNTATGISDSKDVGISSAKAPALSPPHTVSRAAGGKYNRIHLPNHSLFAVFDGHGGSFAAEYSGLNFVRVLSRQPSFVQYAHFIHQQNKSGDDTATTNSDMDDCDGDNAATAAAVRQAQLQRRGIELLESAFRDAFLDLDREIWRCVHALKNEDCILPRRGGGSGAMNTEREDGENEKNHLEQEEDEQMQQDSGTTAVVVMMTPTLLVCANAGDSRAVYSKQGNCAIPLSYDHKPDDEEEERRIIDAGGFVRVGRVDGDLAVSRGLGDFRFKEHELYRSMGTLNVADIAHLNGDIRTKKKNLFNNSNSSAATNTNNIVLPEDQKVSPVPDIIVQKRDSELDEFVMVGCDGIFDVQTNSECISLTADIFGDGEADIGLLCEEILDACLEKGSKDNMTALVVKFPAQTIGQGGGVNERRRMRQEAVEDNRTDES